MVNDEAETKRLVSSLKKQMQMNESAARGERNLDKILDANWENQY